VVHLLQRAQEAGALPAGFGVDQAVRLWRIMSASARAIQRYRPETYPGRALVFVAKQSEREGVGPDLGWGRLTAGVEVVELEARHATLLRGPALQIIADVLGADLRRRRRISAAVESGEREPIESLPAGHVHAWPNGTRIVAQTQTEAEHAQIHSFEPALSSQEEEPVAIERELR
jgi:hypothetical protein